MADFRKLLLALIAGALLFGTVASAQSFSCQVSANPTLVRSESVADMVGNVNMACSGILDQLTAANGLTANIRLTFGQSVTSKVLQASPKVSEATLILDRGVWPDGTKHPKGYLGTAPLLPFQDGSQNIYQAIQISDTELEWQGVVLVGPGSANASNLYNVSRDILMTDVRINAQGLTAGVNVVATVNITSPTSITIFGGNSPTVANVRTGMTASHLGVNLNNCDLSPDGRMVFTTTFIEGFGTAFKPRVNTRAAGAVTPAPTPHYTAGTSFADESGYSPLGWASPIGTGMLQAALDVGSTLVARDSIGLATQGTRFQVTVTNVPAGVTLSYGTIGTLNSASNLNPLAVVAVGSPVVSGTTVTLTWEVSGYNEISGQFPSESLQDTVNVQVVGTYSMPPVVGTARAHARLVPNSLSNSAVPELAACTATGSSCPVPRFVDSLPANSVDADVFVINQTCKTLLLFPYITSSAGYNTGIAITNTSVDPLGESIVTGQIGYPDARATKPQAGACTLYFYGQLGGTLTGLTAGQHAQTIVAVPAGGQFVTNLAVGAKGFVYGRDGSKTSACGVECADMPNFVGYMIAACNFQWAHGFAFVTDTGSDRTMGYLALVIPDRGDASGRLPQDNSLNNAPNQGEQLGQ